MQSSRIALSLAAAALAGTAPGRTEPPWGQPAPVVRSTATPQGEGRAIIRNAAAVPLTAYLVEVLCDPCSPIEALQHTYRGYDAVTAQDGNAVPPSDARTERLGACHCNKAGIHEPAKAAFKAALFADGTAAGEQQWADVLIRHRAQIRRAVESVMEALGGMPANATPTEYLARLKQARNSLPKSPESMPRVEFPDFDPFALATRQLAAANPARVRETVEGLLATLRAVRAGYPR